MFQVATLSPNYMLELPSFIAEQFQPSDQFVVWLDGDTLHLKRINPSPLKAVEEAPDEEPMSFDELDDIVHEVRRQRQDVKV
ncbi:MAG: hypothetical protein AAF639_00140 [Chloroflexota bacterium]